MVTIYDLLEVSENASKEEIEKSYKDLLIQYQTSPSLSEQINKENTMILNKLKMAYDILMNDEKRKKYDSDLAKKRAEELIKNVTVSSNNKEQNTSENVSSQNVTNNNGQKYSVKAQKDIEYNDSQYYDNDDDDELNEEEDVNLSKDEQKKVRKAAQKEFQRNLKKAQKAEKEYNQAYNEAYNNYLKKMGYNKQKQNPFKKILNTLIVIIVVIVVCFIAWLIPPVRNSLISLYEENVIIKGLVDIFIMLIKAILSIFK